MFLSLIYLTVVLCSAEINLTGLKAIQHMIQLIINCNVIIMCTKGVLIFVFGVGCEDGVVSETLFN